MHNIYTFGVMEARAIATFKLSFIIIYILEGDVIEIHFVRITASVQTQAMYTHIATHVSL